MLKFIDDGVAKEGLNSLELFNTVALSKIVSGTLSDVKLPVNTYPEEPLLLFVL